MGPVTRLRFTTAGFRENGNTKGPISEKPLLMEAPLSRDTSLRSRLPKNCRTNLSLGYSLLDLLQPHSHTGKILPLGLVVLPEQPHVPVVMHPLWTLGERL
jgi:hypothetical protein